MSAKTGVLSSDGSTGALRLLAVGACATAAIIAAGWVVSVRRLRRRADRDGLTGLLRRDGLERHAAAALARSNAVGLLDLEGFKAINDTYGHPAGDYVLQVVAERLVDDLGEGALVGRFGGDEFALIAGLVFPDLGEQVERLMKRVTEPVTVPGVGIVPIGASLGIVWLRDLPAGDTGGAKVLLSSALAHADIAMYAAKAAGGGWALYQAGEDPVRLMASMSLSPRRRYREHGALALVDGQAGSEGVVR